LKKTDVSSAGSQPRRHDAAASEARGVSGEGGCPRQVKKRAFNIKPFIYKNDHFTKTGSGQTKGKILKSPFCRRTALFAAAQGAGNASFFWSHLHYKT
jgi:hypothetical protein